MVLPQIFRSSLVFHVIVVLSRRLVCRRLIKMFGLSLACYNMIFFLILLRCFICLRAIQTSKMDSINRRYQIMIVSMLKNWNRRYSSHYIIKFIGFMLIYYIINLNISSFVKKEEKTFLS